MTERGAVVEMARASDFVFKPLATAIFLEAIYQRTRRGLDEPRAVWFVDFQLALINRLTRPEPIAVRAPIGSPYRDPADLRELRARGVRR